MDGDLPRTNIVSFNADAIEKHKFLSLLNECIDAALMKDQSLKMYADSISSIVNHAYGIHYKDLIGEREARLAGNEVETHIEREPILKMFGLWLSMSEPHAYTLSYYLDVLKPFAIFLESIAVQLDAMLKTINAISADTWKKLRHGKISVVLNHFLYISALKGRTLTMDIDLRNPHDLLAWGDSSMDMSLCASDYVTVTDRLAIDDIVERDVLVDDVMKKGMNSYLNDLIVLFSHGKIR